MHILGTESPPSSKARYCPHSVGVSQGATLLFVHTVWGYHRAPRCSLSTQCVGITGRHTAHCPHSVGVSQGAILAHIHRCLAPLSLKFRGPLVFISLLFILGKKYKKKCMMDHVHTHTHTPPLHHSQKIIYIDIFWP